MKIKGLFIIGLLSLSVVTHAQEKYFSKSVVISFYSNAPLEDITATHKSSVCLLDTKTGNLQFSTLIKGFEFENKEMQDHFNEHYLESDKYPKAEFKGEITNNATVNYSKPGDYPVQVKGQLTIHGVTKPVQTSGVVKVENGTLQTTSSFSILVADYGIQIPSLVKDKIAKNVKIIIDAKLNAL